MQRRSCALLLVIAATLFVLCAGTATAQSAWPSSWKTVTIPSSSTINVLDAGVRAHTNIQILGSPLLFSGVTAFSGPPYSGYFYEDPASLACVYGLTAVWGGCNPNVVSLNPSGGNKAIAIVDAYDDPDASGDLATFSTQFGLSAPKFSVVYAPHGGSSPGSCVGFATAPPVDTTGGWEVEESLDIEWAHAMAPGAKLYLVEAQSNSFSDLLCAVTTANNLVYAAKGGEVSMSWGGDEFSAEKTIDSVFTKPGVVYFASSGDNPGVSYPSASPNVVSVGGTSIGRNPVTGSFVGESNWQPAGSGPSAYEVLPTYQNGVATNIGGNRRGTPDIASDADPDTGVWVLDNFMKPEGCGSQCWYIVGGTSVSAPTWAGIVNTANSFSASTNAELTRLYGGSASGWLNQVSVGSCGPYMGFFDAPGWNFCTGLGSPRGYQGK